MLPRFIDESEEAEKSLNAQACLRNERCSQVLLIAAGTIVPGRGPERSKSHNEKNKMSVTNCWKSCNLLSRHFDHDHG